MRAITGAIVSSAPCPLRKAGVILSRFSDNAASHLPTSDCATYVRVAAAAASNHNHFLRVLAANLEPHVDEGLVNGARERQGSGLDEVPAVGPHGSIEEAEVAAPANEKKSKKRKHGEEPHEDKAAAGVTSHIPPSPEILSEQRKKRKEKHSSKELVSVMKQETDLVAEEDGGSERKKKKKKDKHSDKEVTSIVKQEPGLVVEEMGSEKKKGKKKKEKGHVNLEVDVMEVKEQVVINGVVEQGVADGDKKRKKKHHSKEESKGVKEEKMTIDNDLNSEKKKKKRGRGDDADNAQEQGEHKRKKQRKASSAQIQENPY